MTPTTTTQIVNRIDAVDRIAAHLADRDAFIVLVSPSLLPSVGARLRDVPAWVGWLDAGLPTVLRTGDFAALGLLDILTTGVAVIAVPKTVPASVLAEAMAHPVAEDGSQDILLLHDPDGPMVWPMIFVEALERVDPRAAMQLRATDVRAMS